MPNIYIYSSSAATDCVNTVLRKSNEDILGLSVVGRRRLDADCMGCRTSQLWCRPVPAQ